MRVQMQTFNKITIKRLSILIRHTHVSGTTKTGFMNIYFITRIVYYF